MNYADALHNAGRWQESAAAFREAEAMQAERQPQYPRLYSVQGYQYCDLLLALAEPEDGHGLDGLVGLDDWAGATPGDESPGYEQRPVSRASEFPEPASAGVAPSAGIHPREGARARYRQACKEVHERADFGLQVAKASGHALLTFALFRLVQGRAHLGLAWTSGTDLPEAAKHLTQAVDGLRESGQEDDIPRGLLARSILRRLRAARSGPTAQADLTAAAKDLQDAQDLAERGHMQLFEADAHLEWTRLHLQTGCFDTARRHFETARDLVEKTGYGRRDREVAWLADRVGRS